MKNTLIIILSVFCFSSLFSQEFKKLDFEIKNPLYFVGAHLKVEKNNRITFKKNYEDLSTKSTEYISKRAKFQSYSNPEIYKDIEFKVLKVIDSEGNEITEIKKTFGNFLVLLDLKNEKTVYFKFDEYKVEQYFLFKDFSLPEDYYCDLISLKVDKFSKDSTYRMNLAGYGYGLEKNITKEPNTIILYLKSFSSGKPSIEGATATILFTDGTVTKLPGKVSVSATSKGYMYSYNKALTDEDIELLLNKEIESYKLDMYERSDIYPSRYEALNDFLTCFLNL